MANTRTRVIDAADYQSISLKYGYIRSHLTTASGYLYDTVYLVVQFYADAVEPTLDLLKPFYDTYQIARTSLLDNSLYINAVRSLNTHVINRGGYANVDSFLSTNNKMVSDEFAAISADAGYTIGSTYIDSAL